MPKLTKKKFLKSELQMFKKILLEKKATILKKYERDTFDMNQSTQNGDIVDVASHLLEKEMMLLFNQTDKDQLKKIDEALERITNQTYGFCIDTGELINPERLRAIPETKRSLKAQEMFDRKK